MRSLIALALLPSAVLSFGMIWYGYTAAVARTDAETRTAARSISADIDRHFVATSNALQALASSPSLAQGELAVFHAQAREFLVATDLAANIFLLTPDGEQLINTREAAGTPLPAVASDNRGLVRLAGGAAMAVSDLYRGPVTRASMVAVAIGKRLEAGGSYVLAAGLDTARLTRILESAHLPTLWTVSILDSRGVIAARLPRRDEFIGQPATIELARELDRSDEGYFRGRTKEGTVVRAIFSRAPQSRFVVAIGIPEGELLAPLRTAVAIVAAVLAAVLGMALVLAQRVSRRIASSAAELAAEAVLIGRRPAGDAPRLFFMEADQVRLGLNIATAELQQSAAELRAAHEELDAGRAADLAAMIDAALEPMLVVDAELKVTAANGPAQELFGRGREAILGLALRDLVTTPASMTLDRDDALEVVARHADGTKVRVLAKRSILPTGSSRCLVLAFRRLE